MESLTRRRSRRRRGRRRRAREGRSGLHGGASSGGKLVIPDWVCRGCDTIHVPDWLEVEKRAGGVACGAPWRTPPRPSAPPSAPSWRPTSRTSIARCSRSWGCPRPSRARCSRATRATRARCGGCSSTSSPATSRPGPPRPRRRRRRGRLAGRAALRADLRRLRRRLGRPARGRARRLRVGLQRADEGPAAPAAGLLPRAVHPLHRLRRAHARRRLPLLPRPDLGPATRPRWTSSSTVYAASLPSVAAWAEATFPAPAGSRRRARRAVQAKALDLLRGLLPAASLSHMGIYATGQAYEQLMLHLLAHPLPEARAYGRMDPRGRAGRHAVVRRPRRAPRPRRRVGRLPAGARGRRGPLGGAPGPRPRPRRRRDAGPSVRLLHVDGDEEQLLAALLFEAAGVDEETARLRLAALGAEERARMLARPRRRAREPPPPPRPRVRGAALPLRGRRGLRRLPRPAAPPDADGAVAAPDAPPRRRRARGGRRRRLRGRLPPRARGLARPRGSGWPPTAASARRPTRCASATGSASCSTSTRARRCSSSSCAPAARGTRATAPWPTRSTARSARCTPPSAPR